MSRALDEAASILSAYGFDRNELRGMAQVKMNAHADALKGVLFESE